MSCFRLNVFDAPSNFFFASISKLLSYPINRPDGVEYSWKLAVHAVNEDQFIPWALT